MGLSTVSQNLNLLEQEGLIEKNGFFESTGGRKANALQIVSDFKISIGIGILKGMFHITAVDLYGNAFYTDTIPLPYSNTPDYYKQVTDAVKEFISSRQYDNDKVLGISIATQGITSPDHTTVLYGDIMNNAGMKLDDFSRYLPYPCYLEHDSKSAAFLELWNHPELDSAVIILLNRNLGGGIITNHQIHQGISMHSGTLEHMCINPDGPLCYCGSRGCLETYCSANALEQAAGMPAKEFFPLLREKKSPQIIQIWKDFLNHLADPGLEPKNYWANTSGNSVISHFIDSVGKPQKLTRMELEQLVNGGIVQKEINSELTYKELYSSIDNLWSTLFMTGYLTQRGEPSGNRYNLVIPNREIRNIITNHILKMFKENVKDDGKTVSDLCDALLNQNPEKVELIFTEYMKKTISIRDTFARKPTKENFYHGLLLGILGFKENWSVMSNRESGDGFGDILIRIEDEDVGIVIEVKYADDGNLQGECEKALQQIIDIRYTEALEQEGIHTIIKYGIACYRKKCKVLMRIDKQ